MQAKLNFPLYDLKITETNTGASRIFDIVRKRYFILTPEEWVRQHLIHYLVNEKKFPLSLFSVERILKVNGLTRRTDVLVYKQLPAEDVVKQSSFSKLLTP